MRAARVHHAARRRGGGVAAGGACAAGRADAAHRRAHAFAADDPERQARVAAFLQGLQQSGLDRRPQPADRLSLGRRQCRRHAQIRGELVALAPDVILAHRRSAVAPLLQATRTVPIVFAYRRRSGRRGLCREPVAAGRQRHRLYRSNTDRRKMAGICSNRLRRA